MVCCRYDSHLSVVSVLFSEPKIPQSIQSASFSGCALSVSVLFSEPKIPQCVPVVARETLIDAFQCSSASRKFLNRRTAEELRRRSTFQCSSASRKFLNRRARLPDMRRAPISVLFSEPKIPQCCCDAPQITHAPHFSALQRAENSSISNVASVYASAARFQCSSASRKFLNQTRLSRAPL